MYQMCYSRLMCWSRSSVSNDLNKRRKKRWRNSGQAILLNTVKMIFLQAIQMSSVEAWKESGKEWKMNSWRHILQTVSNTFSLSLSSPESEAFVSPLTILHLLCCLKTAHMKDERERERACQWILNILQMDKVGRWASLSRYMCVCVCDREREKKKKRNTR